MFNPNELYRVRLLDVKEPYSIALFTESVADLLTDHHTGIVGTLASLSLSVEPHGPAELQVSNLTVDSTGLLVSWLESEGVPARLYTLNLTGITTAGLQIQQLFRQFCDQWLAVWPPPRPIPGFGLPTTWVATTPTGGLQDSSSNDLVDSSGNPLFGSPTTTGLVDSAGNILRDSSENVLR